MVLSSGIVCDHDRRIADDRRSMFPYDRRRSQTLLRSAICDPRSYGDQPLCSIFCDRLRSSAIMIAGSQTIAEVCFHMIADDRRRSQTLLRSAICDLRSAIIWKPAFSEIAVISTNEICSWRCSEPHSAVICNSLPGL